MGLTRLGGWLVVALLLTSVLVAAGADLRLVDAVENRESAAARTLLEAGGVDVNATQTDGTTALHWAAHWEQADIADLLLEAGAEA